MFMIMLIGWVIAGLFGSIAYWILKNQPSVDLDTGSTGFKIFWGTVAVLFVLLVPLTAWLGVNHAINSNLTFNENWGGFEVRADWQKRPCHEDGYSVHNYQGDAYEVTVDDYDTKGRRTGSHTETRYHTVPYTTEEWDFTVQTTIGGIVIAKGNLPEHPDNYRYKVWDMEHIPASLIANSCGIPMEWTEVKARLDQNKPGPVTLRNTYKNYILASSNTILTKYSDAIVHYKALGLLPELSHSVHGYQADAVYRVLEDRVYFVGLQPLPGNWERAMDCFNGALGMTLQGDCHLVIADANKIDDKDDYRMALAAYWQDHKVFGKDALSKNGIVVVVGTTDGTTVAWTRAATGMPGGNESMLVDLSNIKGVPLTPESLLGPPKASLTGGIHIEHGEGALEKAIWGEHKFQRVHMGRAGKGGIGGYTYLLNEVQPTDSQYHWMVFWEVLLPLGAWVICFFVVASTGISRYYRYRRW